MKTNKKTTYLALFAVMIMMAVPLAIMTADESDAKPTVMVNGADNATITVVQHMDDKKTTTLTNASQSCKIENAHDD